MKLKIKHIPTIIFYVIVVFCFNQINFYQMIIWHSWLTHSANWADFEYITMNWWY